jgi:hypothetical protein
MYTELSVVNTYADITDATSLEIVFEPNAVPSIAYPFLATPK